MKIFLEVVAVLSVEYVVALLFWGLPGLLMAALGWRVTGSLQHVWLRAGIRAGLASVALVPTPYGHAGLLPASVAVFFPPVPEIDWVAIWGLLVGWLVAFGTIMLIERPRMRR